MPSLNQLNINERGKVISIEGGKGLHQKLHLHGIFVGSIVEIISNTGPLIIEVDRNVISIGKKMALKITVEKINGKS